MKKWILLTVVLISATVSCTKFGKNITVKGRVINPITNEPISGITVFMHQSWKSKTIKKMVTGQDGEFELSATHLGHVWAGTDYANYQDYYDLGWDYQNKYYSEIKVEKGKIMNVDYHLVPYAYLKLQINNINCMGTTDVINVYRELIEVPRYETWSATHPYVQNGCTQTISPEYFEVLMGKYHFWWDVTKNSITTTHHDTIFLNKGEYKVYEINY